MRSQSIIIIIINADAEGNMELKYCNFEVNHYDAFEGQTAH
jgi:hypothetical protein